ncbi:MAG TPA: hypothetical protein VEG38_19240 [Acidimicrobiia bacterium]|nr:hypothetical protein [Acidimicrobiia bacterium]
MRRPNWPRRSAVRRWLVAGAVVLLVFAGRVASQSFSAQTVLSDGARAYASCKAPWRSARIAAPAQRFTLWVMTGGTGARRPEGVATLGAQCRAKARRRIALATMLLSGAAVLTWLALPNRGRPTARDTMPG